MSITKESTTKNHTVTTKNVRSVDCFRDSDELPGVTIRRVDTFQVTAQLQENAGRVFRNGARIA